MDELSGVQTAALIRLKPEISYFPIIMMSGFYDEEEVKNAMKTCNIKKIFKKPVDPQELIDQIELTLEENE